MPVPRPDPLGDVSEPIRLGTSVSVTLHVQDQAEPISNRFAVVTGRDYPPNGGRSLDGRLALVTESAVGVGVARHPGSKAWARGTNTVFGGA